MTVTCSWCGKNMGEKCLKCGNANVVFGIEDCLYYCRPCDRHFFEGEGGTSHSACDTCLVREKRKLEAHHV